VQEKPNWTWEVETRLHNVNRRLKCSRTARLFSITSCWRIKWGGNFKGFMGDRVNFEETAGGSNGIQLVGAGTLERKIRSLSIA